MSRYFIIYKPYDVLCQFSPEENKKTLADLGFPFPKDVYPVGRLDEDSEGLLILTNDKSLNSQLLNPVRKHNRTYWVQVEGLFSAEAAKEIENGVFIKVKDKEYLSLPGKVIPILEPQGIPDRIPPVRFRANIPTSWISLTLHEGKNRQVRKMTAKVGFPTLRLIRYSIENLILTKFIPAKVVELSEVEIYKLLRLTYLI